MAADAVTKPAVTADTPAPPSVKSKTDTTDVKSMPDTPDVKSMPDTPDVKNVRADLGEDVMDKYMQARTMVNKFENKEDDKDVDDIFPASALLVGILQTVPQDKTKSAGYAEVLLLYGRVLFGFAKRDIFRSAILGGDVEAEVLKSQLQEALAKKEEKNQDNNDANINQKQEAAGTPSKNVEKAKAVPTLGKEGAPENESKSEDKTCNEPKVEPKDEDAASKDETKSTDEVKVNGDAEMTAKAKKTGDAPATEAKEKDEKAEETIKADEGKTEDTEKDSEGKEAKENGDATTIPEKKSDDDGKNVTTAEKDEDAIMPAVEEKKEGETEDVNDASGDEDEEEEEDVSNETLTWEQLEYARSIFEQLGAVQRHRLPDVYEALGDLLLETDQSEKAAAEYVKALDILEEKKKKEDKYDAEVLRVVSNLNYQRYVALRKEKAAEALGALKAATETFREVVTGEKEEGKKKELEEVLNTMAGEVEAFEAALPAGALAEMEGQKGAADEDEERKGVTIVQPRRRVRKVVEEELEEEEEGPVKKKARVVDNGEANKSSEGFTKKEEAVITNGKGDKVEEVEEVSDGGRSERE